MRMLFEDIAAEEPGDEEAKKKAEDEKKKSAAPAPAAPPAAPDPEKPLRVRKAKVERPALPLDEKRPAPSPAALPPPAAPAAPDTKAFEESLEENEREMLSDAKDLEKRFPEKYKGFAARTEKFIRDHIAWTERAEFDDQDPEYRQFLTGQPTLTRGEIRQLEEARISDNLRKEYDGKFTSLQHQTFVREHEPKISQLGQQVYSEIARTALPEDVLKELTDQIAKHGAEKGYTEAVKSFKMEIETSEEILAAAADDIKEFHRLNTKDPVTGKLMVEFATEQANPKFQQHQRIASIINDVCESFKNNAGEDAVRAGKWFVTREEWHKIRPDQRSKFWTFTNAEIITQAKKNIKGVIAQAIATKTQYLKDRGWSRSSQAAPPAPPPPTPTGRPAPGPAPVPGANGPGATGGPSQMAKDLAARLNAG